MFDGGGYQSFDYLGETVKSSDSAKKYEQSKLGSFDLEGKSILDIGCNAGYFLFRILREKNPAQLVGIDLGKKFIEIAYGINKKIVKSNKIKFIHGDFFETIFPFKFDLILCFSTFHYFLDKQCIFFKDCFFLLKDNGTLLLEVEEYPNNSFPIVDKSVRPADKKRYHYPNQAMVESWYNGLYSLEDKYISVKQGGSLYDRHFYKLRKN